MEYIKLFETHNEYETYVESEDYVTPNVSYCEDNEELHFSTNSVNAINETTVIAYFYIDEPGTYQIIGYDGTNVSGPEDIEYLTDYFTEVEVDGVVMDEITGTYQFDTAGVHVVKYTLADPTEIGDYAFAACENMVRVKMPTGITSIGDYAFILTDLRKITIPETVTTIGAYAFKKNSNTTYEGSVNLIIPNSVTSIGTQAFYNYEYEVTTIFVGESVSAIGQGAFSSQYGGRPKIFYFFNTTPPEVNSYFVQFTPALILVPPTSVDDYKSATGFTNYTAMIHDYNYEFEQSSFNTGSNVSTSDPITYIPEDYWR